MARKIRWFFISLFIAGMVVFVVVYPIPSLLRWQSACASRCFFILMMCFGMCLYRIMRGPTPADRAASMFALGVLVVGFCAILSIPTGKAWYIDIAIAWALQSFIGALAISKFLEGKGFDE